ncbi:HlyD family secretion protein [Volucribacter psittacicida]|uniref:HlyD family secretion protein n=1 Tax=Volucribacter psittacicida TaxID=203482 RepID=UPI001048DFB0|nr:HlyD family secretion protein [Volucribacter psittacicida]
MTQTTEKKWQPKQRSLKVTLWLMIVFFTAILLILYIWRLPPFSLTSVQTNNAYIRGNTTFLSPKVTGYVEQVLVEDFDKVEQGQVLVKIEQQTYQAKQQQAEANLMTQQASLQNISQQREIAKATIELRKAGIMSAEVSFNNAQIEMGRAEKLLKTNAISKREYDNIAASLKQAKASLLQAQAQLTIAEQDLASIASKEKSAEAMVINAQAALALAQQDLYNTLIKAPVNGKLSQISVKQGQFVNAGTQLFYLVPSQYWVIANFKEADTEHIKVGQTAKIKVDARRTSIYR